jgi:SHS2 domain-containing protein
VSYRWSEHIAELGLDIEAASPQEVFTEAGAALGELVGGDDMGGEQVTRTIALAAVTYGELLVLWLEELVFLVDTESFVPERSDVTLELPDLDATVTGHRGTPRGLVKAVTAHELAFAQDGDAWRAHVALDRS